MNIKYLFVVSLVLFIFLPKSINAQSSAIDITSLNAFETEDENLPFPNEFGTSNQQTAATTQARSLQNANKTRNIYSDNFGYRWYIQAGGGVQMLMGEDDRRGSLSKRLTIAPTLTAGYRWNPIFGVRLNFSGGSLHGFNDGHSGTYRGWRGMSNEEIQTKINTDWGSEKVGDAQLEGIRHFDPQWLYFNKENPLIPHINYDKGHKGWRLGLNENQFRYMQHVRYASANAAVTMNLFNLFGGVNDSRKFDISIHAGPTFFHTFSHLGTKAYNGFGANGGVQAQYHLSDKIGLFAEASGSVMPDGFDGQYGNTTFDLVGQTILGVTYKFPMGQWQPKLIKHTAVPTDDMNDELNRIRAELMAEFDQIIDLQPEIDKLRKQLEGLSTKTKEVIVEQPKESFFLGEPVHFAIGKTDIDAEGWSVIERVAEYLKNTPEAIVIITGYADKDTGTDAINERLSRERSKKVADALTFRFNVPQGRIAIDWRGDSIQPFYQNQMNRAVLFYIEFY